MENTVETTDLLSPEIVAALPVQENPSEVGSVYSADDIAKAREQEKAKLYPQMEKMKEELASLKKAREEQAAKEAEREKRIAEEEAKKEAQKKEEEESELSFKELLKKKEQQLEAERLERERAIALLDQERKFQEVMNYRQQRVEQERDSIVPELIDLIDGNNADEIEQSIAMLKEKSARILSSAQQAMQSARQQMAGTRITNPAAGPLDNDSEQKSYSPDSIREMSLADYAKQRAKLLGTAASNRGQGLFG
jgi:DNA repair exonuclease SbcCD ATPase subunit